MTAKNIFGFAYLENFSITYAFFYIYLSTNCSVFILCFKWTRDDDALWVNPNFNLLNSMHLDFPKCFLWVTYELWTNNNKEATTLPSPRMKPCRWFRCLDRNRVFSKLILWKTKLLSQHKSENLVFQTTWCLRLSPWWPVLGNSTRLYWPLCSCQCGNFWVKFNELRITAFTKWKKQILFIVAIVPTPNILSLHEHLNAFNSQTYFAHAPLTLHLAKVSKKQSFVKIKRENESTANETNIKLNHSGRTITKTTYCCINRKIFCSCLSRRYYMMEECKTRIPNAYILDKRAVEFHPCNLR